MKIKKLISLMRDEGHNKEKIEDVLERYVPDNIGGNIYLDVFYRPRYMNAMKNEYKAMTILEDLDLNLNVFDISSEIKDIYTAKKKEFKEDTEFIKELRREFTNA